MNNPIFSLDSTRCEKNVKDIDKLRHKKASQNSEITVKINKENKDLNSYILHHNFNNSSSCCTFSTAIKHADIKPIHKRNDKTDKENFG